MRTEASCIFRGLFHFVLSEMSLDTLLPQTAIGRTHHKLIALKTSHRMTTSRNCTRRVVNFRSRGGSGDSQFLIPNCPFQYVRGESPHRGTAPAGTEGKAPGAAIASVGGAA